MGTALMVSVIKALLSGGRAYAGWQFGRYQASRDQARKVSRAMEEALGGTARLLRPDTPARSWPTLWPP